MNNHLIIFTVVTYFTAPLVIPLTTQRWNKTNIIINGTLVIVDKAIIEFQFLTNCPKKAASPTVSVCESGVSVRVTANKYSFHEKINTNVPVPIKPGKTSGNKI